MGGAKRPRPAWALVVSSFSAAERGDSPPNRMATNFPSQRYASTMLSEVVPPPSSPIDAWQYGYATLFAPDAHTRHISIVKKDSTKVERLHVAKDTLAHTEVQPSMPPARGQKMPFHYGTRTIAWSSRLPVPEPNYGVVVNVELPTQPEHIGREVFPNDDGIRNPYWYHLGALNRRVEGPLDTQDIQWGGPGESAQYGTFGGGGGGGGGGRLPDAKELLGDHADYSSAWDIKGLHLWEHREAPPQTRRLPDFAAIMKMRTGSSVQAMGQKVRNRLQHEFLDEAAVRKFFSDPEAVAWQEI